MAAPSIAALYSLGSDGPAPTCTRSSSSSCRIEARAPGSSCSTIDAMTCRISDSDAFWTMRSRISLWVASRVRGARSTPRGVGGVDCFPDPILAAIATSGDPGRIRVACLVLTRESSLGGTLRVSGRRGDRPARYGRGRPVVVPTGWDHRGVPLYRDEAVVLRVH